jgi:hypothetical protein
MNWGMTVIWFAWLRGSNLHFNERGMQSGHPLTSSLNCVFHYWSRKFIFHMLYPLYTFRKAICYMGHGDDANTSVNPEFPDYNMITVAAMMLELFGMKLTSSDKTDATTPYINNKSDFEFLSRKFDTLENVNGKRMFVHKLKMSSIISSLNYIRVDPLTEFEAMQSNIRGAQKELMLYGKETFDKVTNELIFYGSKTGYTFLFHNYEHYLRIWTEEYYKTDSPVLGKMFDPIVISY